MSTYLRNLFFREYFTTSASPSFFNLFKHNFNLSRLGVSTTFCLVVGNQNGMQRSDRKIYGKKRLCILFINSTHLVPLNFTNNYR